MIQLISEGIPLGCLPEEYEMSFDQNDSPDSSLCLQVAGPLSNVQSNVFCLCSFVLLTRLVCFYLFIY